MAKKMDNPKAKKPTDVSKTPKKRQCIGDDWEFKQKVLDALKESLGIIMSACMKCKISRPTFYKWYKEDPKFRQAVDDINEDQKDFVESCLIRNIKKGDSACTIFYCKTRMKDRGYAERIEITGEDGGELKAQINVQKFGDVLAKMAPHK